jgi:predicted transcriptional regulator
MKEIMLPVRPKWCELIASGKKIIEARKTIPKCDVPFKVDIYCTKPSKKYQTVCGCMILNSDELFRLPTGKIKYGDSVEMMMYDNYTTDNFLNGKVIGEFVCDRIINVDCDSVAPFDKDLDLYIDKQICIDRKQFFEYTSGRRCFGWHISALIIYDKPKQLSDFYVDDKEAITGCRNRFRWGQPESVTQHGGWIKGSYCCMKSGEPEWCEKCLKKPLVKPPKSWCYVERRD